MRMCCISWKTRISSLDKTYDYGPFADWRNCSGAAEGFFYFDAQIGKNAKTNAGQTLKQTLAI